MSELARFWLVIGLVGAGTFAMRVVPMAAHGRVRTPRVMRRLLKHLPAAALTALAVPGILYAEAGGFEFAPVQLAAGVGALLVALRTKSIVWSLAAGMGLFWLLEAVL